PELWHKAELKFKSINNWLNGDDYPTYKQLKELAKIFHIPFGYFFLNKLPKEQKLPIPHYRTTKIKEKFIPSLELKETIQFAQKVQEWAKEILIEFGQEPLPFTGKYNIKDDKYVIINELKNILDIQNNWASLQEKWIDAFNFLRDKAEEKGIIVLINGIVGNNTHRKLDINEFRGFVLYDEIVPVIFINNNDAISAKIFTIIHELFHILIGQGASFDLEYLQSSNNEIEKFCNECTAEFLVPEKDLKEAYKPNIDIEDLAKQFKVSQMVILRRLLDMNIITKDFFLTKYEALYKYEHKNYSSKGGKFYSIEKNRLSKRFLNLLQSAVNNGNILYRDALRITQLNARTYEKLLMNLQ
ncbi:MAG: ImmA/IrrE family metallo-endopeptidase, partial [Bacteroidia bacterium]